MHLDPGVEGYAGVVGAVEYGRGGGAGEVGDTWI